MKGEREKEIPRDRPVKPDAALSLRAIRKTFQQGKRSVLALDKVAFEAEKGKITGLMKTLGGMDPEERKTTGQALNVLKDEIADLIATQEKMLKKQVYI